MPTRGCVSARGRGRLLETVLGAAFAAGSLAAPASAGPAVAFAFGSGGCGPSNVEGFEFRAEADVTVSALGAWDDDLAGFAHAIPVGLYDSACQELASVTLPAGTAATLLGQYRYASIPPVALSAGQSYRVAAVIQCDDFSPGFSSLADVTVHPAVSGIETRRIAFGASLACPTETGAFPELAPNFLIGSPCGNGLVESGEACDDDDTVDGDCCSAACTLPAGSCRTAAKSQLLVKDDEDDAKDKLVWKWTKGQPTSRDELADPTTTSDYALCLYDASGLVLDAELPADGSRWSPIRDEGFKYADASGAEDGFTKVVLRGSAASRSKAVVNGKGVSLPVPPLGGLPLPLSVQLRNAETGVCLEASYGAGDVVANGPELLKARAR